MILHLEEKQHNKERLWSLDSRGHQKESKQWMYWEILYLLATDSEVSFKDFCHYWYILSYGCNKIDKTEVGANVDLKMRSYKKDMEKDEILNVQMKLTEVLITKN